MAIPSQYRRLIFIGGRYLEDREVNQIQQFYLNAEEQGAGAVYREGSTFNVGVQIGSTKVTSEAATVSGSSTVTLYPIDPSMPMLVFLDGRFEPFTASPLDYSSYTSAGAYPIYVDYEIAIISAGPSDDTHDPALIDTLTGAPTAEAGQLNIQVNTPATTTYTGALNDTTQVEKNTTPIIPFNIVRNGDTTLSVLFPDNVNAQALANEYVSGL